MSVHMKNGRARRKMFADVNTKRDLVDMLSVEGWTLQVGERQHVGWTALEFNAVKGEDSVFLGAVFKGDKGDWNDMWVAFCQDRGMDHD
jgi:hypothetical protein